MLLWAAAQQQAQLLAHLKYLLPFLCIYFEQARQAKHEGEGLLLFGHAEDLITNATSDLSL